MNLKGIVVVVVLTLVAELNSFAQVQDISTDRPDQSNTPQLVPKGALQVETGFLVEKDNSGATVTKNFTYNNTLLRFGINQNFEMRLNTLYQGSSTSSDINTIQGFGPLSVGMKIKLSDKNGFWPQTSFITHINLRSGSNEFKPSYLSNDLTLSCAHDLSERWSLTYNGGFAWNGESPEAVLFYAVSAGFNISEKFSLFAESYAFIQNKYDPRVDAGLTYRITPLVQFDVSGGLTLSAINSSQFLSTGLSIRLFN